MVGTFRKNSVRLVIICCSIVPALFAGGDEELFLRGNKFYTKKDYDNALQAYDMIPHKGRAVLYNMGNCYFRTGDYSRALVYWSRAEVGATAQEYAVIQRNKEFVLKKVGIYKEPSLWHKVRAWLYVIPYISLFFLQLLLLAWWWLFMFLSRKKQTGIGKYVQGVTSLCIVLCAAIVGACYTLQKDNQAIVVKKEATLFAGPDKSFQTLSSLAYADSARVQEAREGWYKIQYADMIGWVEADVIHII